MSDRGLSWPAAQAAAPTACEADPPAHAYLRDLLSSSLVVPAEWARLPPAEREQLEAAADVRALLRQLVARGLLTEYQAGKLEAGATHGLLLGNYRVLARLGSGGMGVVFKGEHRRMRRPVAIKVLGPGPGNDEQLLERFFAEIQAVGRLQHPNIVAAMDAGEAPGPDPDGPEVHYLVMEYVPGQDLEEYVRDRGPLPAEKACDLIHQAASALAEAHRHELVHRDIKPGNIRVTPEGQAKLLDFGLARHRDHRTTLPGAVIGTVAYMAPEQAQDAAAVDIRADVYGLGGTLFFLLTGRPPFPPTENPLQALVARVSQPPPSAREVRPGLPAELDAVVMRMMATEPAKRYPSPQAVMRALMPFLKPDSRDNWLAPGDPTPFPAALAAAPEGRRAHAVLIADDEPSIRQFCRYALEFEGLVCEEAPDGSRALSAALARPYDLVLLDIDMPGLTGAEVCRRLREAATFPHRKIIMMSGRATPDEMARMLSAGADDYLSKPLSVVQLQSRVKAALRLRDAQERSDLLTRHLLAVNAELERNVSAKDSDLVQARNALVLALAKLVEYRDTETGAHLMRLQRYSRYLAEEAMATPAFAGQITPAFVEMLECCAPLHDIGKVGLPDHILLKPAKLDPDERLIMQTHTVIGSDTLNQVARQHGFALAFLQMAADIARHHHERWDGRGYPDRLAGEDIPLAARIVSVGDVYDALRARRVYKPALSHPAAVQMMTDSPPGHFDPALFHIFQRCHEQFERIYRELAD